MEEEAYATMETGTGAKTIGVDGGFSLGFGRGSGGPAKGGAGVKAGASAEDGRREMRQIQGRGDSAFARELANELMEEYKQAVDAGYDPSVAREMLAAEAVEATTNEVQMNAMEQERAAEHQKTDRPATWQTARDAIDKSLPD